MVTFFTASDKNVTYKYQINNLNHLSAVPPDIMSDETSGDVSVQELENATLTCKATGHPPPKITWRREDHEPVLLKKPQSRDFDKGKKMKDDFFSFFLKNVVPH